MKIKLSEKIVPAFKYHGCGFPVTISNAPLKAFRDDWVLDMDLEAVDKRVAMLLMESEYSLTGAQVKFLRTFLEMNQRDFAEIVDVTHAAVVKWEATKNHQTKMDTNTERFLRIFIMRRLGLSAGEIIEKIMAAFVRAKKAQEISFDASLLKTA
jgi:DNA-binding transcriptional regulator YiaG